MAKHTTIWKSYGMLTLEETDHMEKQARERLEEFEDTTTDVDTVVYEDIDMWFDDEKLNLNKKLDGRILCIADMGLWNGRRTGYKILGNNLNEVLTCGIGCDEKEVYCDGFNVLAKGHHHDGTSYVEFREIREDKDIEPLLNKLYSNEPVSRAEIRRYTKSLRPYIKEVYGV